jgi:hypothetical protein
VGGVAEALAGVLHVALQVEHHVVRHAGIVSGFSER